jgi:signal transduction histidine kinase
METNNKVSVLLIEDNPVDSALMGRILSLATNPSYKVECRGSMEQGLERLSGKDIDLILLDLSLPDSEGFETFVRTHKQAPDVPIVVLTGCDDEKLALEALRRGAQDYLVKTDVDPKVLTRVIRYAVERKKIERQLRKANEELARDEKVLVDMLKSLKRSNSELKMTQLQLIQAEKLEVIGRLAAGVAHEVKNPLAMLRMGTDYFAKQTDKMDEKGQFVVRSMVDAIRRADFVIKGMLDFASTQELHMTIENLAAVIEHSLFFVKHELDRHQIVVAKNFLDRIEKIQISRNRIEQVFINIFTNAIRAVGDNGQITIDVRKEKLEKAGGIVGFRRDDIFSPGDTVALIEITDSGPGIPEDVLNKIFDPFFTTYRTQGGTGLGLSVVKSIVQMHHGHIEIHNAKGAGACVRLLLKMD